MKREYSKNKLYYLESFGNVAFAYIVSVRTGNVVASGDYDRLKACLNNYR